MTDSFRKRAGLALLSAAMLTPAAVSCGEAASAPAQNNAAVETVSQTDMADPDVTEYISDGLPDTDFEGYEFRIADSDFKGNHSIAEDFDGTRTVDALRESTLWLENRFNIKIVPVLYKNETKPYENAINAGEDAFDVMFAADWTTYPMAKKGMFVDMYTVDQFDFSKPWWPDVMLTNLSICGSMYCSSNYMSYTGLDWTRAMFINKNYAEQLGLEVPYDTVRDGKWTLDAMLSYVKGASYDIDGDGVIGSGDKKGFTTGTQTWYCFQECVDIPVYRRDGENVPYIDFNVDKIDVYVTKMRELVRSSDFIDSGDFFGAAFFRTGNALLCYGQISNAYESYRDTEFSFGFLPSPKYDETQQTYINCCTDRPWAIPVTATEEQIEIIGTVCEALSCRNYQYVLPEYFEVTMKDRLAEMPDDAEMLQLIADTRTTSFSFAYELPFRNILGDLINNDTGVSSYYEKYGERAQKQLDKLIDTFNEIKSR